MSRECPARHPDVVWREEEGLREAVLEGLARQESQESEGVLTLVVAGSMHQLNLIGAEIWKCCDGRTGLAGIVDRLQDVFDVERAELEADVTAFIEDLIQRGWLV